MSRRRSIIAPRKPAFVGCEGESEQAYGQVLYDILKERERPFHLEVVNLSPGAGNPTSRLLKAEQEINRRSQRRSEFKLKVVFLDFDQVDRDLKLLQQAQELASKLGIRIIWQEPCHEAFCSGTWTALAIGDHQHHQMLRQSSSPIGRTIANP
jgi:hypothetical protein